MVASDLLLVMSIIQTTTDLERISDEALRVIKSDKIIDKEYDDISRLPVIKNDGGSKEYQRFTQNFLVCKKIRKDW